MIKAVILDVDGIIVDTEEANAVASIQMFRELYNIEVKPEDFVPFVGTGSVRYLGGVAEKYGIDIDVKKATKRREKNFVKNLNKLRLFPGVKNFIQTVKQDKLKIAIATSADRSKFQAAFRGVGLVEEQFDLIVTGDEVKHTKPHPEIYLTTTKKLGLEPSSCLVVEDSIAGVEAAKKAGTFSVAVTNTFSKKDLAKADLIIGSLEELDIKKIKNIIGRRNKNGKALQELQLKVVIDTSIFIASFWEGKSRDVVELWKKGKITLCVSKAILKEYLYIIPRFNMLKKEAGELLSLFEARKNIEMVSHSKRLKIIKEDPADNKFLECAVEARAEYILSADKHLRDIGEYEGIKIVSSGSFLKNKGSPHKKGGSNSTSSVTF